MNSNNDSFASEKANRDYKRFITLTKLKIFKEIITSLFKGNCIFFSLSQHKFVSLCIFQQFSCRVSKSFGMYEKVLLQIRRSFNFGVPFLKYN